MQATVPGFVALRMSNELETCTGPGRDQLRRRLSSPSGRAQSDAGWMGGVTKAQPQAKSMCGVKQMRLQSWQRDKPSHCSPPQHVPQQWVLCCPFLKEESVRGSAKSGRRHSSSQPLDSDCSRSNLFTHTLSPGVAGRQQGLNPHKSVQNST